MTKRSNRLQTPLWIGGLALVLLCPAACPAASPDIPGPRTMSVSGEGAIRAVPDEAVLSAGVVSQAATAEAALAENRRAMNAVFAALKREGIPEKSIQTSQFSVSPQYAPTRNGASPRISAYQVSNGVTVTVDDLSRLGSAIDALVASGANTMGDIAFTIRDPKALLAQARAAAVRDAMARAQTYADAAGVKLGAVDSIAETGLQAPRPMFRVMAAMAGNETTPIAAGEQTISAQVTMTFEIR